MTDLKLADQIDDMINPLVERRQRTLPTAARVRFETIYNEIRDRICLLRYPPGHTLGNPNLRGSSASAGHRSAASSSGWSTKVWSKSSGYRHHRHPDRS